jgi:hypothetical protein
MLKFYFSMFFSHIQELDRIGFRFGEKNKLCYKIIVLHQYISIYRNRISYIKQIDYIHLPSSPTKILNIEYFIDFILQNIGHFYFCKWYKIISKHVKKNNINIVSITYIYVAISSKRQYSI